MINNILTKILMAFTVIVVIVLGIIQFVDFELFEELAAQAIIGAFWIGLLLVVIWAFSKILKQ